MADDTKEKLVATIEEEAKRMGFGKLLIEVSVMHGKLINVQVETRRSVNLENKN